MHPVLDTNAQERMLSQTILLTALQQISAATESTTSYIPAGTQPVKSPSQMAALVQQQSVATAMTRTEILTLLVVSFRQCMVVKKATSPTLTCVTEYSTRPRNMAGNKRLVVHPTRIFQN